MFSSRKNLLDCWLKQAPGSGKYESLSYSGTVLHSNNNGVSMTIAMMISARKRATGSNALWLFAANSPDLRVEADCADAYDAWIECDMPATLPVGCGIHVPLPLNGFPLERFPDGSTNISDWYYGLLRAHFIAEANRAFRDYSKGTIDRYIVKSVVIDALTVTDFFSLPDFNFSPAFYGRSNEEIFKLLGIDRGVAVQ